MVRHLTVIQVSVLAVEHKLLSQFLAELYAIPGSCID